MIVSLLRRKARAFRAGFAADWSDGHSRDTRARQIDTLAALPIATSDAAANCFWRRRA